MIRARQFGVIALGLVALACAEALLTAPAGAFVTVFANPGFIPATGGISVISAIVTEPAGTLVPDGTVVLFFTTLGRIDPQGKTHNGVARVNLLSDGRSGTATVSAVSGGNAPAPSASPSPGTTTGGSGAGSTTVAIGPLPANLLLSAVPNRLTDSRTTHLFAQVYDAQNNPLPNVPVIFSIDGNPVLEHLDSGGLPVFTDNNGVAEDILRTRQSFDSAPRTVTVRARTPNGTEATALVTIN